MTYKILAINLGGTTTKLGVFNDCVVSFKETLEHSSEELKCYSSVFDQKEFRRDRIIKCIKKNGLKLSDFSAVVTRGGILPPIEAGAYEINREMIDYTMNYQKIEHASNLGVTLAHDLAKSAGEDIKAYIYDGETLDQLADITRITGVKMFSKQSLGHLLNMRAVVRKAATDIKVDVNDTNFVVAHMGGGTSIGAVSKNRIIDVLADDEGPFSVERAGSIANKDIIELCYQLPKEDVLKILRMEGGLYSYLGTNDGRQVEEKILAGDGYAKLVYEALAYQVAKGISEMGVALRGQINGIILTGGLANSTMICEWIEKWCGFLGPVIRIPGEYELEALAEGICRVLNKEESSHEFKLNKQ